MAQKTSAEIAETQKRRDRQHHTDRIIWLQSGDHDFDKSFADHLIRQSQACLADASGMVGYNTCHCDPPCEPKENT